jgi:preprotein translocase SecE subunit
MLDFFYDSLDTLKKVKKPTQKEIWETTVIIFVVVIISAIIFVVFDTVFGEAYKAFYSGMKA